MLVTRCTCGREIKAEREKFPSHYREVLSDQLCKYCMENPISSPKKSLIAILGK